MLVTFNIAFLYISAVFRFLKQKVINIKNAGIACDRLEARNSDIQNYPVSDIIDVANGSHSSSENEKSSQVQEISLSSSNQLLLEIENVDTINFVSYEANLISSSECNESIGFDISEANIQNEKSAFEQNQNSSSCVENSTNSTSDNNSNELDNYQVNANSTSNYYVTESEFETDRGIKFYPPVYIQRYNAVRDVLTCDKFRGKIKKVVEFGCAEMTFFTLFLKRIYEIEEVIEVDIDCDVLNQYFHKISPQTSDYIKMRTTPLKVQLYEGSVAYTGSCLSGTNAVVCIELIEHLYPDELDSLPFTIFGYIRPQVAIFTTPNADFNVLFPGLSGFRHHDHKFEWSREQFQSWANNLIVRYPNYRVSFEGIGKGPAGTEEYGCCSQMAVFYQKTTEVHSTPLDNTIQSGEYKLLREYDFPVYVDLRTEEQKIRDSAVYYINRCRSMDICEESSSSEIPLTAIFANVNCHSLAYLRDILEKDNWNIRKNEYGELVIPNSDPESEEYSDNDNDYCWESNASALQCSDSYYMSNSRADSNEDWNDKCNPLNLSGSMSTEKGRDDNTLSVDSNSGFWTTENPREYRPIKDKQISEEKINMCTVKEEEFLSDSNSMMSELVLLNESKTDSFINSTLHAVDLCNKLHTETSLGQVETSCNQEPTSKRSFDTSIYKTPCKCGFFCSQNTSNKSLLEEEQRMCNDTLTDTESIKYSSMHVEHHKGLPDLHNNDQEKLMCSSCNPSFNASEVAYKLLAAEELQKDTPLMFRQNEEQVDCNDVLESNESSEMLMGLQDSCSACKAVDSGYPNTSSCQDMDMDLTPEQVDEILTENESSLNSTADYCGSGGVGDNEIESDNCNDIDDCDDDNGDDCGGGNDDNGDVHDNNGDGGDDIFEEILRPGSPIQFQVVPLGQNVENGDLVNNNQDNEGNNMIGQVDEEILEFEVQINENGDLPVLAAGEEYGEDKVNDEVDDIFKNHY